MSDGISSERLAFDPSDFWTAAVIACPACHADLRVDSARLECGGCGRRYPIVDGIPVLIVERAEAGDPAE